MNERNKTEEILNFLIKELNWWIKHSKPELSLTTWRIHIRNLRKFEEFLDLALRLYPPAKREWNLLSGDLKDLLNAAKEKNYQKIQKIIEGHIKPHSEKILRFLELNKDQITDSYIERIKRILVNRFSIGTPLNYNFILLLFYFNLYQRKMEWEGYFSNLSEESLNILPLIRSVIEPESYNEEVERICNLFCKEKEFIYRIINNLKSLLERNLLKEKGIYKQLEDMKNFYETELNCNCNHENQTDTT